MQMGLPLSPCCPVCSGSGKLFKTKKAEEVLEVFVEKGAPTGNRVVFSGKADETPGCEPGDVVVIFQEQEHPEFKRKGTDLYTAREITLLEALTGFTMEFAHLDGRQLRVRTISGEVVQPLAEGTGLKAVKGEGMPTFRSPFVFGNLFLVLTICFPEKIAPENVLKLRRALAPPNPREDEIIDDDEDVEICYVEDMDPLESAKQGAAHCKKEAYDEDRPPPQSSNATQGGARGGAPPCPQH